jgi:hypothetical protein
MAGYRLSLRLLPFSPMAIQNVQRSICYDAMLRKDGMYG